MSEPRPAAASFAGDLPEVAVVVVNWNGRGVLRDCFASLQDADYPRLRLIMVDNGSVDESVAWTRRRYPQVEIIEAGRNLRWAAGNNLALARLLAEGFAGCVLLLNNDTMVPQGSMQPLVRGLLDCPQAWAATPRICYADDPARTWYDGGVIGRYSGWVRHNGIRRLAGRLPAKPHFTDYGTGCALLLGPGVLQRVGLLDESFYFYAEDADYSLRIRRAGGRILHVPRALVLHKVSATLGDYGPRRVWLRTRSHIRLLGKHWPWRLWPLLAVSQGAFLCGHAAYHLWHGRPQTALAVMQGALDELSGRRY